MNPYADLTTHTARVLDNAQRWREACEERIDAYPDPFERAELKRLVAGAHDTLSKLIEPERIEKLGEAQVDVVAAVKLPGSANLEALHKRSPFLERITLGHSVFFRLRFPE